MRFRSGLTLLVAVASSACCTEPKPAGRVIWKVPSTPVFPGMPYSPVANASRTSAYFATVDFRLKKLRASDGAVLWDVSTGAQTDIFPRWNAVLAANVVAITKVDVLAYDTTTGAFLWKYKPADGEPTGESALTSNDSTIFAAGYTGRMHAIDAKTGTARWVVDLRKGHTQVSAFNPTLKDDVVFVCTKDFDVNPNVGTLWALDAMTGATKWSYVFSPKIAGRPSGCYGAAAFHSDVVIMPEADGRVFAFDRVSGAVRWAAPPVHDEALSIADERYPAVAGNIAVVTSNAVVGRVVAYDAATGVQLWQRITPGSFFVPVMDSAAVYLDHGSAFVAYDVATGNTIWQVTGPSEGTAASFKAQPIIAGTRLLVAGGDGSYAVRR